MVVLREAARLRENPIVRRRRADALQRINRFASIGGVGLPWRQFAPVGFVRQRKIAPRIED